jgi:hypothetical protein
VPVRVVDASSQTSSFDPIATDRSERNSIVFGAAELEGSMMLNEAEG